MPRPALEIADIFRDHGPAWRTANAGHVSLDQLKVMSAIEACRTARLGGTVVRCDACQHMQIQYCSCRNRHCPKCQSAAARQWLADREADLLPVPYHHVVFTLPAAIARIAWHNKAVVYDLLFKASAETLLTIAADPRHLGARIGLTAVLHTRAFRRSGCRFAARKARQPKSIARQGALSGLGDDPSSAYPHDRARRGISLDGRRWISRRPDFFLAVRVLSALFRRLMLQKLAAAHAAGRLAFHGADARLAQRRAFMRLLGPLRRKKWFVYSKPPFAGPKAVLAYLARYTHRVAISNRRLIRADANTVTFKVKDYRVEGPSRYTTMTLATHEFIRRFLMHVLPKGLHVHPPLRPPRQRQPRRQSRPHARAARRRHSRARSSRCRRSNDDGAVSSPMPVLWRADAHHADRPGWLHAAHRRGAACRDPDRYLMRSASRLTRKCRAPAAGQSSRGAACLSGHPNGHDGRPDLRNTIAEYDRTARRMPAHDLGRCRKLTSEDPRYRRQRPNPHRDCGDA